jgi:proteasome lid subunit RPN8/RPN11
LGFLLGERRLGGRGRRATRVYRLTNAAANPAVAYDADYAELFDAQRRMRERGERTLAIYHSHPRQSEPAPSEKDVRLAFDPSAVYFIIGFDRAGAGVLRAFRISEAESLWEPVGFAVAGD